MKTENTKEELTKEKTNGGDLGVELVQHIVSNHITWYAFYWTFSVTSLSFIVYGFYSMGDKIQILLWSALFLILFLTCLDIIWSITAYKNLPILVHLSGSEAKRKYADILKCVFNLMLLSICALFLFLFLTILYLFFSPSLQTIPDKLF